MDFNEYKEELSVVKENYKSCVNNKPILESEVKIVETELKLKPLNRELLRLKVKVLDRYNLNEEMIKALSFALKILRDDKETSSVYYAYIDTYADSAKRFIELSESEEFRYLAYRHIDNAIDEHIEK